MSTISKLAMFSVIIFTGLGAGCMNEPETPDTTSTTTAARVDQTTPELAVETLYTGLQTGNDTLALAVVPDDVEATEDFQDTWAEVSAWDFNEVTVGTYADGYVEVEFDITVDGDNDTGTDQVAVEQIDGLWWVTEIPQ